MANLLFKQCDGVVARLPTKCNDDSVLFRIKLDNRQITLPVTGFALEVGGNYQFLHTVSDFIYFYAFGDRVGELNVTGMAFIKRACAAGIFGGFFAEQKDAIDDLWDLYERNRISSKREAIRVSFGNVQAFYGFLTGMRAEIARPDIPVCQYVLRIHVIPKN
jgi:hypothetical protein